MSTAVMEAVITEYVKELKLPTVGRERGGPQSLDRYAAYLRWNPVVDSCRASLAGHPWAAAQG